MLQKNISCYILGFALMGGTRLAAQNLESVMPEPVPEMMEASDAPVAYRSELEKFRHEMVGATRDEAVLLEALKGIVFLKDESELGRRHVTAGQNSNLADFPEWNDGMMSEIVDTFVGLPVSAESLERLRLSIRYRFSELGRPFSIVYTPPQDITDGYVSVVLVESSVGQIRVEGAERFSEASYLSRIHQSVGEQIDADALAMGIERINQNAFRRASVRAEKGEAPGTTDLVLQAIERRPYRYFAGYNNAGSETTQFDRMYAGMTWGNVFGLAHQATVQVTSDFDVEHSKSISGNYSMDLPRGQSATLFGAYSKIASVPNGGFNQEGESWQVGANYRIRLSGRERFSHSVELGVDYKSSDNNLELNLPPYIIPISDNLTHIAQGRFQYSGSLTDSWGSTGFGTQLTYSPGGVNGKNSDTAFRGSRAGASAEYLYFNLNGFRSLDLNQFLDTLEGWSWQLRGELQLSNRNLLSSEQFSAGGSATVRGYRESEVVGDNAILLSQELYLPAFSRVLPLPWGEEASSLRAYLFQDYARTWNTDKLAGERAFDLHSVGAGFRYQLGRSASFSVAHGWQLRDSGGNGGGDSRRAHVSLQFSY